MAGHSKWANIKHRKAKQDALKGKLFTKLGREIYVAARLGGGDPENNPRLKNAIAKAKEANMPMDSINRTIKKALGEVDGVDYEELIYEGYGPGGVAVMMEIMTDNRNRTAAEIRHIFNKYGGSLGEAGCVAWMFNKKGYLLFSRESIPSIDDFMLLALEAGAEDVKEEGESVEVITAPDDFEKVKTTLMENGYQPESSEITMLPQTTVSLEGEVAEKMLKLMDALEDHDDVQNVYANFDIPEESMK
ncbi:MAG: hypothetical protein PWQ91_1106 [Eubacteriales bacterium]|nr:hypothetical protein [Eubacteriales bacterium]MDN5364045.1 hypothetical protein [Eubacteriales bacterium]